MLERAGYRAVFAPTHRFLEKSMHVAKGFEQLVEPKLRSSLKRRFFEFPTESALAQLLGAAQTTKQPLFAWVHVLDTHGPYRWNGGKGPKSKEGQAHAARDLEPKLLSFLRAFKAARTGRPLVIALLADHGEEFGEHGGSSHSSTIYAEQVRVMFELSAPGLVSQDIDAPVSTASLPRTLLDLLGLEQPCSFTQGSLLGCIAKGRCPTLAVSEFMPSPRTENDVVGYTGPTHRLLYDRVRDVVRLFDSARDPLEQHDLLLAKGGAKAAREEMARAARAWDKRYCVRAPEP